MSDWYSSLPDAEEPAQATTDDWYSNLPEEGQEQKPFVAPGSIEEKQQRVQDGIAELRAKNMDQIRAQKAFSLSREEGLPMEVAYRQADKFVKSRKPGEIAALRPDAPASARHLSKGDHLSLYSEEDVKKLGAWEKLSLQWEKTGTESEESIELSDIGYKMRIGEASKQDEARYYEIKQLQASRSDFEDDGWKPFVMSAVHSAIDFTGTAAARSLTAGAAGAAAGAATFGGIGAAAGTVAVPGVGTVAGGAGGAAAGAVAGGSIAFGGEMMLQTFNLVSGQAYLAAKESLDENGEPLSHEDARNVSTVTGVIGGAFELVGLKMFSKALTPSINRLMSKNGVKEFVGKVNENPVLKHRVTQLGKTLAAGGAGEAAQEVAEQTAQIVSIMAEGGKFDENGNLTSDQLSLDNMALQALGGFIGGVGMSAGLKAGAKGIETTVNYARSRAQARRDTLVQMGDAVRGMSAAKNAPAALSEYAKELEADTPSSASVDASALQTLFQSSGLTEELVLQQFPELAQAMTDAAQTGAEVPLSKETLIKIQTLDKAAYDEFANDVRTGPEEMTARESAVEEGTLDEMISGMSEEQKEEAVTASLVDEIVKQMSTETDFDARTARASATALIKGRMNMLKRAGWTLDDIAARTTIENKANPKYAVQVAGAETAGPGAMQQGDVTQSPAFREWFGNSAVVDAEGKPLVVYHGTKKQGLTEFSRTANRTAADFYFTPNRETASVYGEPLQVFLKAENLIDIRPENMGRDAYIALQSVYEEIGQDFGFDDVNEFAEAVTGGQMYQWNAGQGFQNAVLAELNALGYDGVRMVDMGFGGAVDESYVVFSPNQIKSVHNRGTFDPADPNILFQSAPAEGSAAFRAWAGTDEPVIAPEDINGTMFRGEGPWVMRAFHGTTHEFDEFNASIKGEKGGQFGAVNYFTSSQADASDNYAGRGPDLTNRIETLTERLEYEIDVAIQSADDNGLTDPQDVFDEVVSLMSSKYDLDSGSFDNTFIDNDPDAGIDIPALASDIASRVLDGGDQRVLEVFIRTEKPFVVGGGRSPFAEFIDFAQLERDAMERVADDNGLTMEEVEASRDEYEDAIQEARWEIEGDMENPLITAVQTVAFRYDADPAPLLDSLYEYATEGISHDRLEEILRSSETVMYAEDQETGDNVGYHMLGEIIEELGFDSIILMNANDRFANMNIEPGTAHVHVFDSHNTNIKSVENTGAFDRSNSNIYYQNDIPVFYSALLRGVEASKQPKAGAQQWIGMLKNMPGIKQEELDWLGVEEWLKSQDGPVTREQLAEYIRANQVEVQEVVKGEVAEGMETVGRLEQMTDEQLVEEGYRYFGTDKDDMRDEIERDRDMFISELATEIDQVAEFRGEAGPASETKFSQYQLPGGDNYREVLLTLPVGEGSKPYEALRQRRESLRSRKLGEVLESGRTVQDELDSIDRQMDALKDAAYTSSHWDEPNVLAHVRFNEREVGAPLTAEEQAAIAARKAAQPELNKLSDELGKAIRDRAIERDIILEKKREELRLKVRAGEIRIPEMQRQLDALVFGPGAVQTEALKRQREIQARYDALRNSLPPMPERKTSRTLFIEEIQSDWHQQGRKMGYRGSKTPWQSLQEKGYRTEQSNGLWYTLDYNGDPTSEGETEQAAIRNLIERDTTNMTPVGALNESGVPDAPLKTTWPEFAFKRMLRYAVDNGFDQIAWTPGDVQAERYDLSKQINLAAAFANADGTYQLIVEGKDGQEIAPYHRSGKKVTEAELEDTVGKEVAAKLIEGAKQRRGRKWTGRGNNPEFFEMRGLDLKVGGEGMKGFYDQILPKTVNKMVKKWGGKVGTTQLGTLPYQIVEERGEYMGQFQDGTFAEGPDNVILRWSDRAEAEAFMRKVADAPNGIQKVWSLDITDEMREAVPQGLSLFQTGDQPRGFIEFTRARDIFKITLTGNANLSTFLHESGHYFLELMTDLVETGQANPQMQADLQMLRDWAGVGPDGKFNVEQHEKFARGFERYLMEGNAPSVGLRALFNRFKGWLSFIYKSLGSLNVDLSDEVRGVMDRMLASDEEIAKAKRDTGRADTPMDQETMGMTDPEYEQYIKVWEASQEAEKTRVDARLMKDYLTGQKEAFKNELARVTEEMAGQIQQGKAWRVWDDLKGRQVKIERDSIPADLRNLAWGLWVNDGSGLPMDVMAESMGYDNGKQMLQDIASMRAQLDAVPEQARKVVEDAHGFIDDKEFQRVAQLAIHQKEQEELMLMEYMALTARDGKKARKGFAAWINNTAKNRVGQLTHKQIQPAHWRRAELKAAQQSAVASSQGDTTTAALAKRQQLMASAMHKASLEALERVDQIRNEMMRFNKKSRQQSLGKAGEAFQNGVNAILEMVSFRATTLKARDQAVAVQKMMDEFGPDSVAQIPPEVAALLGKTHYKDMTIDELEALYDTVTTIYAQARKQNKLRSEQREVDFQDWLKEVDERTRKSMGEVRQTARSGRGFRDYLTEGLRWSRAQIVKQEFLTKWMDGETSGGPAKEMLFDPIAKAEADEWDMKKRVYKPLIDRLRNMPKGQRARLAQKVDFMGNGWNNGAQGTGMNILMAALNMGNAQNLEKLTLGYGWNEEQLRAEVNTFLRAEDWALVQSILDDVNKLWPDLEREAFKATGIKPPKVEAMPIDTPYGEIPGGYFPVAYDLGHIDNKIQMAKITEDGTFVQNHFSPSVDGGMTKKRTKVVSPIRLEPDVLTNHLRDTIHYITHYEAVSQVDRILRRQEFRKLIYETAGEAYYKQMRSWLKDVANGSYYTQGEPQLGEKWLHHLRTGTSLAFLGFGVGTMAKQQLGLFTSLSEVKPTYLASGMAQTYNPVTGLRNIRAALNESSELQRLIDEWDRDFGKAIDDIGRKLNTTLWDKIRVYAMRGIAMSQLLVNVSTYIGAKNQRLDAGDTAADAQRYAEAAVRMTQSAAGMKDMSPVQRANEATRMITPFFSFAAVFYNRLETIAKETGSIKDVPKAFGTILTLVIAPSVATVLLDELLSAFKEDDEDDKTLAEKLALETTGYFLMGLPIVRDVMSFSYRPSLSPYGQAYEQMQAIPKGAAQLMTEGEIRRSTAKQAVTGVSVITKLPLHQPYGYVDDYFGEALFEK